MILFDEKLDLLITNQQKMQADILDIKVHLENVTDKNIKIIHFYTISFLYPVLLQ